MKRRYYCSVAVDTFSDKLGELVIDRRNFGNRDTAKMIIAVGERGSNLFEDWAQVRWNRMLFIIRCQLHAAQSPVKIRSTSCATLGVKLFE